MGGADQAGRHQSGFLSGSQFPTQLASAALARRLLFPPERSSAWQDVAVQDDPFEKMRQAVYAVAAVSGRIGPDALDRDHDLRGLLFAIFAAGAAQRSPCCCAANRSAAVALPPHAGNQA